MFFKTGVPGYVVRSQKTGYTDKSIFLPAAGSASDDRMQGRYWTSNMSSSIYGDASLYAVYYFFDTYVDGMSHDAYRCYGLTIRPVYIN